jgi:hypothetical protein
MMYFNFFRDNDHSLEMTECMEKNYGHTSVNDMFANNILYADQNIKKKQRTGCPLSVKEVAGSPKGPIICSR